MGKMKEIYTICQGCGGRDRGRGECDKCKISIRGRDGKPIQVKPKDLFNKEG